MRKLDIEEMYAIAASRGGKCLSTEYIRAQSKLSWVCSEEHQFEQTPAEIKRGAWCPICRKVDRGMKSIRLLDSEYFWGGA
jgi:hypothetical protein